MFAHNYILCNTFSYCSDDLMCLLKEEEVTSHDICEVFGSLETCVVKVQERIVPDCQDVISITWHMSAMIYILFKKLDLC